MEFLRYPQVIPILFNAHRFGPPRCLTIASTCSWIGHPVSGLLHATLALFRLGFPAAPVLNTLTSLHKRNSLARSSISTTSHSLIVLSPFVNIGFQVLFHSPPGVLFTFPSRYCSSIGHQVVFSLGGWSPLLPTRFHVPCGTLDTDCIVYSLRVQDCYLLWCGFPTIFCSLSLHITSVLNPRSP